MMGSPKAGVATKRRTPPRRAVVGAALIAVAALGVFSAHRSATATPTTRYIVASHDLPAGTVLTAADLGTVAIDLPSDVGALPASDADKIIGHVIRRPASALDLMNENDVFDKGRFEQADSVEVALDLPPARALFGVISAGSVVDVLATDTDRSADGGTGTHVVATGVLVQSIGSDSEKSIGNSGLVRVVLSVHGTQQAAVLVDTSLRAETTLVMPKQEATGR